MDVKINTSISNEYDDIQITIKAPSLDSKTQMIKVLKNISVVNKLNNLVKSEKDE